MPKKYSTKRRSRLSLRTAGALAAAGSAALGGYLQRYTRKRVAKKHHASHSKTKMHQSAKGVPGSGGTYSTFFYGRRKMPRAISTVYKQLAKNYRAMNGSVRLTASVGTQNVNTPNTMFSQSDLTTIAGLISASNTTRYCVLSCSAELMLTNQDLANVRVYIYDIIARRDLPTGISFPDGAWGAGYADEGGAASNDTIIGATPYSSDQFTQFFKVLKTTHVTLGQGQSHSHRIRFAPNRTLDQEYIKNLGPGAKGLTCFTMVVYHGLPENDSTTKTQVSTGQVALDCVWRRQYKYTYLPDYTTTWTTNNTLPAAFTVAENIVDIGAGSIVTDSTA